MVRRELHAIQYFGQSLLEPIPPGEIILAERPSTYQRMIEAVRLGKRYLIFERDLTERAEPLGQRADEVASAAALSKQVRAVVWRENLPLARTDWFPIESPAIISALENLLPGDGGRFMVVWLERETGPAGRQNCPDSEAEPLYCFS